MPTWWALYCSVVFLVWLALQYAWEGWKYLPESPANDSRRLKFIGYLVLVGMAVDLYRVPSPRGIGSLVVTSLVVATVAVAAHFEPWIEEFFSNHRYLRCGAIIAGVLLLSFVLIGCTLRAQWGMIDDHEIMHFLSLGSAGQLSLRDLPRLLMENTEVGSVIPRFRPSYYTLRLLETWLWGDWPGAWYACRIVMFALSAVLFWLCLDAWIGILPATLVLLFCLTLPFWADMWCRLGPSEAYCVVGTALFAYGALRLMRWPQSFDDQTIHQTAWWYVLIGTLTASGSKENFLLLVPAVWFIGYVLWRQRRFGWISGTALIAVSAWGAFVGARVVMGVTAFGTDIYGNSAEATQKLLLVCTALRRVIQTNAWWISAAFVTTVGGFLLLSRDRSRTVYCLKNFFWLLGLSAGFLILYASQYAFYAGQWPCGTRYDFPGVLVIPLWWVTVAFFSLRIFGVLGLHASVHKTLRAGLLVGLCCLISLKGFGSTTGPCCRNANRTTDFTRRLDRVVKSLSEEPDRPLMIVCCRTPSCYEPVYSVQRFLKSKGVRNPLFLRIENVVPQSALDENLLRKLVSTSIEGEMALGFRPLPALPTDREPFVLGLGCVPELPHSISLGSFEW